MRIAAALFTAKRCDKFAILYDKGMPSHPRRPHPSSSVPRRTTTNGPWKKWRGKGDLLSENSFSAINWKRPRRVWGVLHGKSRRVVISAASGRNNNARNGSLTLDCKLVAA